MLDNGLHSTMFGKSINFIIAFDMSVNSDFWIVMGWVDLCDVK